MSGWADLVNKNLDELVDEKEGYKLYPNAKFPFTKERAEEFAKVGLEQLIDDPYFLNQKWNGEQGVWPKIKEILLEFEQVRKSRLINTFLFTSGIGGGKTITSNILLYWQWFEIITLPSIAAYYGLMEGKITAFCILSKDADAAKKVTFMDLLPVFTTSAFVKDYFPPHIELEKLGNNPSRFPRELRFPKNITIFPGTGQAASALGFNIRGASMDEVNDMAWVESSTKARMKQYYSAAEESYREITERMNSRFPWETLHRQGKKHGFITCIGQARFPDSFTEKKILEAQILGNEATTYWVRVPRWELQPKERLSRETFIIDKTNKRVIDFLTIDRYPDLLTQRCPVCKGFLAKGAYVGNNGMLVCSLDCYKETYFNKITVEKEKA